MRPKILTATLATFALCMMAAAGPAEAGHKRQEHETGKACSRPFTVQQYVVPRSSIPIQTQFVPNIQAQYTPKSRPPAARTAQQGSRRRSTRSRQPSLAGPERPESRSNQNPRDHETGHTSPPAAPELPNPATVTHERPAGYPLTGRGTITFVNHSGEPALVYLVGPVKRHVLVPDQAQNLIDQVPAGVYVIYVRYGQPGHYRYVKGESFTVIDPGPNARHMVTITLHPVVGGNYSVQPITEAEFQRIVAMH